MLKYLIPKFSIRDLPILIGFTVLGALIAGTYGIVHDQVTYWIGPEYFTRFKFDQFNWARWTDNDRVFVATIGFLATWWVGAIVAWILTRRMLPNQRRDVAYRKIWLGFGIVFASVLLFGIGGYAYGLIRGPDADYSYWDGAFRLYGVTDHWPFIRVGYIHNAGYMGGLAGLILTYILIRPQKNGHV